LISPKLFLPIYFSLDLIILSMIDFFDRFPESSGLFFQKPLEMKSLLEESLICAQKEYANDYATTDKYD